MIVFAVFGGVIVVLGAVLAWRDRGARRRGAQVSYEHGRTLRGRVDADLTELYHLSMRNPNDPQSRPSGDWRGDPPRNELDIGLIDGPLGRRSR
jgi:hypothetical protein